VLLGLAGAPALADDGPSVATLMTTCRAALAADWQGVDAAACAWYLEPCTVCEIDTPPPTWCVPAEVGPAALATQVLDVLAGRPQDGATSAAPVIREILTTTFPCTAASGHAR
jgi:hypothetical protein